MEIKLKDILNFEDEKQYKVHLAVYNQIEEPLDVFVRNKEEWKEWSRWVNGNKNKLNRKYVFILINFYPEKNIWLFGGVFEIGNHKIHKKPHLHLIYETKLTNQFKAFIGRLKIYFDRKNRRQTYPNLETYIGEFAVTEILKEKYTGKKFPGYENINIGFRDLENIIKTEKTDWKTALENVKGVYLITDGKNGKKYVGAAYGENGVWARWSCYTVTGHGHNDELSKLIKEKGKDYARKNFKLSVLEYRPMKTDDKYIIERENYWKETLLSRGDFGYNKN